MAGPLAKRAALVTGASRGIGAAVARTLAGAGAAVVLVARTSAEVEAKAAEIEASGARAFAFAGDVTEEASVRALGTFARERVGAIDILVNNAGDSSSAPLHKIGLDDWNRTLAV